MKKILLSAAALSLLFAACKKDDNNSGSRQDMLVGTWKMSEQGFDMNSNGAVDLGETAPTNDSTLTMHITFNSNGTGTSITNLVGFGADTSAALWSLLNSDNTLRVIMMDSTTTPVTYDTTTLSIKGLDNSKLSLLDETASPAEWGIFQKQ